MVNIDHFARVGDQHMVGGIIAMLGNLRACVGLLVRSLKCQTAAQTFCSSP
jgi:hypothetical protein